jgi:hypothetical protein
MCPAWLVSGLALGLVLGLGPDFGRADLLGWA